MLFRHLLLYIHAILRCLLPTTGRTTNPPPREPSLSIVPAVPLSLTLSFTSFSLPLLLLRPLRLRYKGQIEF